MLSFRDFVLLTAIFLVVSVGVYYGAGWFERRTTMADRSAAMAVPARSPGPARPAPSAGAKLPPHIAAAFGEDGKLIPEFRAFATKHCQASIRADQLGRMFDESKIGLICDCITDWTGEEIRQGRVTITDLQETARTGTLSGTYQIAAQNALRACLTP